MQNHVHAANNPSRRITLLTVKLKIAGVLSLLFDELQTLNQHTARPNSRIVNFHSFLWFEQRDQKTDDLIGCVEFTSFFARTICKVFNQIFVSSAEQIRKLKVFVDERRQL